MTLLGLRGELTIALIDDSRMAAAHEAHCGEAGTTDVITFDHTRGEGAATGRLDAELLVCMDEARRAAAARGLPVEHELLLYVIHGVLHCLGHDDHDPAAAAAMHRREDEILAALGLPAVFAAPRRDGGEQAGAAAR